MTKVLVVGGGASGMVAAISASRCGADVTILERNSSCGKKLLVTGNGKCNYYNDDQDIRHYHSSDNNIIGDIINKDNSKLVLDFFDSIGVVPRVKNDYYYPYSNQAVTILNALLEEIRVLGVKIINNVFVTNIIKKNDSFVIETDNEEYYADKVIMSSGSYAFYKNMAINSYELVSRLGHSIIKPLPALVQLKVDDKITKSWAGVRVESLVKLYQDSKFVREEYGELLLTNYGISGICAMQLSSDIARGLDNNYKEEVVINFVPSIASDIDSLLKFFDDYNDRVSNRTIIQMLDNILNYKLGNAIINKIKIDGNSSYDDLSYKDKVKLASNIVEFKINIDGTNSFNDAQVCSGGVSIKEIDTKNMESLKVRGLYIVGEMLDVNGDCGGYNLTFAWITGILAGRDSARTDNR